MLEEILIIILSVIGVVLFVGLLCVYLPIKMAKKRGRNAGGWVALFFILSPFWGAILLLVLGDSPEKIKDDIIKKLSEQKQ